MHKIKLIADSGSTKTEWCLLRKGESYRFKTQGLSPYFLGTEEVRQVFLKETISQLNGVAVDSVYFYGTGCKEEKNRLMFKKAIEDIFHPEEVVVDNDIMGAARSICGNQKGIACILGTGSNSCYFDGEKIVANSPGLGFILGDEGSGAILGKSLIQHYLYDLMDDELRTRFDKKYNTNAGEILQSVYRKPNPNRYLASFALFLGENRGHYMVENILTDGIGNFFFTHLIRYPQSTEYPVSFVGSIAFYFKDIVETLCTDYGFRIGKVIKAPMDGLVEYHNIES